MWTLEGDGLKVGHRREMWKRRKGVGHWQREMSSVWYDGGQLTLP